jgi:hypothetical protein
MARTWYNENEKRWEMDPFAASYAVSKGLVGRARIRHDRAMMYIALKGDDREYYVDLLVCISSSFGAFVYHEFSVKKIYHSLLVHYVTYLPVPFYAFLRREYLIICRN